MDQFIQTVPVRAIFEKECFFPGDLILQVKLEKIIVIEKPTGKVRK